MAASDEVLQRFASEAASKAQHDHLEMRDAVARANSASEERYRTELKRERDLHQTAMQTAETLMSSKSKLSSKPVRLNFSERGC